MGGWGQSNRVQVGAGCGRWERGNRGLYGRWSRTCETTEGTGSLGLQGRGNGELKALGRKNYSNME